LNNSPCKTDNRFVSPWNYLDEVKKDFTIPEKVKIHDVTLRDGEQQAGIIFTKDDKIRIAEKLSDVGIQLTTLFSEPYPISRHWSEHGQKRQRIIERDCGSGEFF